MIPRGPVSQGALVLLVLAMAGAATGCPAVAGGLLLGGGYAAGRLALRTSVTQRAILQGGRGDLGLVVGIEAMELHGPRPPLNAALVLDRSGSMSGDKIRHARAAARQFVRAMRPGDRIALVTYSNHAELVVPSTALDEESRERALRSIDRIEVGGMTNLSGGLVLGRDQVLAHQGSGRVNRVILISDGIANLGVTDPVGLSRLAGDLRERGVTVTTMGVGLDFNEDVMMRLADRGGGNYYYIRHAERMADAFRREFGSLSGVVAHRPQLRLELAPGVRVRAVHGYAFEQRGREVRVKLSDIAGGTRRKVVLALEAPTSRPGALPIADVALEFERPGGARGAVRTRVAAEVTVDARRAATSVDRWAMKEATKAEAASALQRAVTAYERGDADAAARALHEMKARVHERAKTYRFDDAQIRAELDRVRDVLRAAPSPSAAEGSHLRKAYKSRALELAR